MTHFVYTLLVVLVQFATFSIGAHNVTIENDEIGVPESSSTSPIYEPIDVWQAGYYTPGPLDYNPYDIVSPVSYTGAVNQSDAPEQASVTLFFKW